MRPLTKSDTANNTTDRPQSWLLAARTDDGFQYIGPVGTGLSYNGVVELRAALEKLSALVERQSVQDLNLKAFRTLGSSTRRKENGRARRHHRELCRR
jgi:ATP-dependent DNA ligase